ncbi:MAG: adenosylcobinamide-GDP ribazoletransferase [bacterium]
MKRFIIALQFLTRLKIPYLRLSSDSIAIAQSTRYFTVVGLFLGLLISVVYCISQLYFPKIIASLITVFTLIYTCRALHLDGFADTIDGLYGGSSLEDKLEIMRDSHIGTMGVVGLILLLLGKILFIANISTNLVYTILFLMPAVGRGSIVFLSYFSNYAREGFGIGRAFTECVELRELLISQLILLMALVFTLKYQGLLFFILISLSSLFYLIYLKKEIGGQTGDTLGALCEINELLFLGLAYLMS